MFFVRSFTDVRYFTGGLRAQSVTQPQAEVPVAEGDPVTVKCTYSVSRSPYLFWYVQYGNQGLQFLLKYIGGDSLVKGNYDFEAEFNKSQTSFHLKKPSVLGSDSALYFCAVSDTVVGAAARAEYKHLSTDNLPKPYPSTRWRCGSGICPSL